MRVSPANSFRIMDGGLDKTLRDESGFDVEARVQDAIVLRQRSCCSLKKSTESVRAIIVMPADRHALKFPTDSPFTSVD